MATQPVVAESNEANVPAVEATNAAGFGIVGKGVIGIQGNGTTTGVGATGQHSGVEGFGQDIGVAGFASAQSNGQRVGVHGEGSDIGVRGKGIIGIQGNGTTTGVGATGQHSGVEGFGQDIGVAGFASGQSNGQRVGVHGEGSDIGVRGLSSGGSGVGIVGIGNAGDGARGDTKASAKNGVVGTNSSTDPVPAGVPGGNGVFGFSANPHASGVFGANDVGVGVAGSSSGNVGVLGRGRIAGRFEGNVEVTGDITLENADLAEDFDMGIPASVEPGTVMVLDDEGAVRPADRAYDKRVAGVVSGAGRYKPAIILDKAESLCRRATIALVGKVFCKVDAQFGTIAIGDLLTTSANPGHAMRASDSQRAFGAVIGKALRPLAKGQGLIPILIALQ